MDVHRGDRGHTGSDTEPHGRDVRAGDELADAGGEPIRRTVREPEPDAVRRTRRAGFLLNRSRAGR